MYPYSTNLVPELQYYFSKFIIESSINRNSISYPTEIEEYVLGVNKSFIRLLFDDFYPYEEYKHLYKCLDLISCPDSLRTRLSIFANSAKYYVCDVSDSTSSESIDFFNLIHDDHTMLNKLLHYRMDSTSVIIYDIVITDLHSNLSKLIYIYLDLKINNNYSLYDNTTIFSDPHSPLESAYECYVADEIFKVISMKESIERQHLAI